MHALYAIDLLFQGNGHRGFDRLRIRAYIIAGHRTCGGANVGYKEMGSVGMQTAPARMINRAQTVANTGRRIKKSTTRTLPLVCAASDRFHRPLGLPV